VKAAVSDILASRAHNEAGLSRLVGFSLAAHVVVALAVAFAPKGWFHSVPVEPELMVISLGGPTGPSTTGTNAIAGKRVDQVVEPTRPQPPQPPAAVKPDEMPPPSSKPVPPKPTPATPPPTTAPTAATTKPPVTGAKVQQGTAPTDTGATGTNTGLTITGGSGGGDAVDLNNFNREWVAKFKKAIEDAWQQNQGEAGRVELRFTVLRDGRVREDLPGVLLTTGSFNLQMTSIRAVKTAKLPPLPADYSGSELIIRLGFDYKR
jgi:outer membrane biosynthesis protein TonB